MSGRTKNDCHLKREKCHLNEKMLKKIIYRYIKKNDLVFCKERIEGFIL